MVIVRILTSTRQNSCKAMINGLMLFNERSPIVFGNDVYHYIPVLPQHHILQFGF